MSVALDREAARGSPLLDHWKMEKHTSLDGQGTHFIPGIRARDGALAS